MLEPCLTVDAIDRRPSSVSFGRTQNTNGKKDLRLELRDEVKAPMLRTLIGGGQAGAVQTAASGRGGRCYTAWDVGTCAEGPTIADSDGAVGASDTNTYNQNCMRTPQELSIDGFVCAGASLRYTVRGVLHTDGRSWVHQ